MHPDTCKVYTFSQTNRMFMKLCWILALPRQRQVTLLVLNNSCQCIYLELIYGWFLAEMGMETMIRHHVIPLFYVVGFITVPLPQTVLMKWCRWCHRMRRWLVWMARACASTVSQPMPALATVRSTLHVLAMISPLIPASICGSHRGLLSSYPCSSLPSVQPISTLASMVWVGHS